MTFVTQTRKTCNYDYFLLLKQSFGDKPGHALIKEWIMTLPTAPPLTCSAATLCTQPLAMLTDHQIANMRCEYGCTSTSLFSKSPWRTRGAHVFFIHPLAHGRRTNQGTYRKTKGLSNKATNCFATQHSKVLAHGRCHVNLVQPSLADSEEVADLELSEALMSLVSF